MANHYWDLPDGWGYGYSEAIDREYSPPRLLEDCMPFRLLASREATERATCFENTPPYLCVCPDCMRRGHNMRYVW